MYRIELINKKTNEIKVYDNLTDMNEGETLFIQFEINTLNLDDGEYLIKLYDEDELVATDTLIVGEFDVNGIQYKKGENIYIETKIDVKLQEKTIELTDSTSIVVPDEGFDGYSKLTVNAEGVYNSGYAEGEEDGYTQGKVDGAVEQRNKLETLTVSTNGNYSRTDGYKTVTVNVKPKLQIKDVAVNEIETTVLPDSGNEGISKIYINAQQVYDNGYSVGSSEGASNQKLKMVRKSITTNGNYQREDGYNEVDVNVQSYSYLTNEVDSAGLRQLGWRDEDINYWKDNSMHYEWQNKDYIVSQWNKNIVITSQTEIQAYKDNPDFEYCPYFEQNTDIYFYNLFNGFKHLKAVPLLDASKSTTFSSAFNGCSNLLTIPPFLTDKVKSFDYAFQNCSALTHLPHLNTSSVTTFDYAFKNCSSLTSIPLFDTSSAIHMQHTFEMCSNLTSIPHFQTSNVQYFNATFQNCSALTSIPLLDTSSAVSLASFLQGCSALTSVPHFQTSNVQYFNATFQGCKALTSIPMLDTSSAVSMQSLFEGCSSLTSIPQLSTDNVTNMYGMFSTCTSLTTIPQLSTNKVNNFQYFLSSSTNIQSLPLMDFGGLTSDLTYFFGFSEIKTLTDLGGFTNLKVNWKDTCGLARCQNLTKQSVMNVINNLYDFRANGDSTTSRTIKFHKNSLALLSDDEKAIATAKGWVLSS